MYGKSSCVVAEQLSETHANVYNLGGVVYDFSYYARQARMIAYLKEANLLKRYELCSPVATNGSMDMKR